MVKRRRIRRKPPVEEVEELEELEEELDDEELDDEDLEEELDDEEEWEEEEEDEEPPPKPRVKPKKVKPPAKPTKKPVVEEVEEEEDEEPEEPTIEVRKVETIVAEEVLTGLLDAMDKNQSIVITKLTDNKWQLSSGAVAVSAGPKLRGQEFWDEVLTPEYQEWHDEWKSLTYAEKKKKAKAMKVEWEEHDDERIDNIRMSAAVLAGLGIEKYNEDYQTRSARARLRGK